MVSVPSTNDRISRWTPTTFACALINFVLAQLLLITGVAWPTAPDVAGGTLAAVHLLTIGWITLLMFGALFQFVPVLTSRTLWSQRLSLATLLLVEFGLAGMVGGFFLLTTSGGFLLPTGGILVLLGLLAGCLNLAIPLSQKRPLPLSARFVIAGLILLLLTVVLGLSFASAFTVPVLASVVGPIIESGVEYHALAGIGGWFTLTAIGVSYELLPMFMLAPHDRGSWGRWVFWTAVAGFVGALVAGLLAPELTSPWDIAIEDVGRAVIACAMGLYLVDVTRMYRDRRRRQIELHNRAAIGAFVYLGITLLIGLIWGVQQELNRIAPTLVFLLIFGWLSGLGLSQLYKIVPFLAWLSRYGRRLGTRPVPRVQDLVNEPAATYMFAAYFLSVAGAAVTASVDLPLFTRGAMVVALVATMLLVREYRRAWHGYYARGHAAPPATLSASSRVKETGHDHARATHA